MSKPLSPEEKDFDHSHKAKHDLDIIDYDGVIQEQLNEIADLRTQLDRAESETVIGIDNAQVERDRIWCKAITEVVQDTKLIEAITKRFNELRLSSSNVPTTDAVVPELCEHKDFWYRLENGEVNCPVCDLQIYGYRLVKATGE